MSMITSDKFFESTAGKDKQHLLDSGWFENFVFEKEKSRNLQLCAFVAVDKDMKVLWSHYCKTIADFPDIAELAKSLI